MGLLELTLVASVFTVVDTEHPDLEALQSQLQSQLPHPWLNHVALSNNEKTLLGQTVIGAGLRTKRVSIGEDSLFSEEDGEELSVETQVEVVTAQVTHILKQFEAASEWTIGAEPFVSTSHAV